MKHFPLDGQHLASQFDQNLADFAIKNANSLGRKYPEPPDPNRLPFQRDRDRILHAKSFRRLRGKMQVVSPNFGDHFRNRLSHTLEVSQIARDIARQLKLNEDLTESIALAHDLGHPPFGHAGERILDEKMHEHGLHFDHNKQSLRIVEHFEKKSPKYDGLNLNQEVLEGIQKHEKKIKREDGSEILWPSLESQLVDISDEIAYLSADLEDGLRGGFFVAEDLQELKIFKTAIAPFSTPSARDQKVIHTKIIGFLIQKLIADTQKNIIKFHIKTLKDVQICESGIIFFEQSFYSEFLALKKFLFQHYYLAPQNLKNTQRGQQILAEIFDFLIKNPEKISKGFMPATEPFRRIADFISGMTDSFAINFWESNIGTK